jgi:hypothetical protein
MGLNLITKAEYKAYAGLTSANHDAEIDVLIPKVSQLVKSYCRRTFIDYFDEAKTEYFNGGTGSLILAETPVVQVLEVGFSNDYGQTYTTLTQYVDWVEDEGYIVPISPAGWAKQTKGYKVTYTAGYEVLPEDVKLATLDLITYYRQNDGAIHSPKAPGTNTVQIEYIANVQLPAHIRRILDMYKADVV